MDKGDETEVKLRYGKMFISTYLSFTISERPPWTEKDNISQDGMIEYVVKKLNELKNSQLSIDDTIFQELLDIFIVKMCRNEDQGAKNKDDITRLKGNAKVSHKNTSGEKETIGMHNGVREVKKYCEKLNTEELYVTVDVLCDLHKILMKDSDPKKAGHFSNDDRFTEKAGKKKYYPTPEFVRNNITHLFDIINDMSLYFFETTKGEIKAEVFRKFILYLAWSFHCIISLHPFGNGNGRVSRLMFYCLHQYVSPLPVTIYNNFSPTNREDYIAALEQGREQNEDGGMFSLKSKPSDLAAMILSCEYNTWRKYEDLSSQKQINSNS